MPRDVARIHLAILGQERVAESEIEIGPSRLEGLLPLAQAVVETAAEMVVADAESHGRRVTCGPACGACCRQVVPIAPVEAVRIARLVASMPEPRQTIVRRRFERAIASAKAIGILGWDATHRTSVLMGQEGEGRSAFEDATRRYFRAGIACPFLEDESCSIHLERPLACREYLVTSDPKLCTSLTSEVELLGRFADATTALAEMGAALCGAPKAAIPLVLALEWAEAHGASLDREIDGTQLFESFAGRLAGE